MWMQSAIGLIYPPQCVACDALALEDNGLCADCWKDAQFLNGVICDTCGTALHGDEPDEIAHCDDCMTTKRPWGKGRAVFAYAGVGRRLVLGLKHADKTHLAKPASLWLEPKARQLGLDDPLLVPVPLHWSRLLRRRYNQSALLAHGLAALTGWAHCPDALVRRKRTKPLEGHAREQRFNALDGAIVPHPRGKAMQGRQVVLVDDVMTSGATFTACAQAALEAGASSVCVLALARVVKNA